MTRRLISYAKIKKAIPGSGGVVASVMKKAGYKSWTSVARFIEANPDLAEMMKSEEDTVDDMAVDNLIKRIKSGDEVVSRWWLARRRKNKFGDNVDVTSGGETILVTLKSVSND